MKYRRGNPVEFYDENDQKWRAGYKIIELVDEEKLIYNLEHFRPERSVEDVDFRNIRLVN